MPNVYILPEQRLFECRPTESILAAALRAGSPFAHACGGHAKCSTCRVVIVEGARVCSERNPRERAIAERLGFGPEFRLACQTRIAGDVTIRRLVVDDADVELTDIRPGIRRRVWGVRRGGIGLRRRGLPQPIGEQVNAAILFADIRGFTGFAEALLPYDVIHVLQRHVREISRAVERHGGAVTSYMGDGVMAVFRPAPRRPPAIRAVRAGLEMLAVTDARRPAMEDLYGRSFEINVGVHYGPTIVGTLWGNPPSATAMGDTVNVASRIEQANKEHGTRFLISDAVVAELDGGEVTLGRSFRCPLPGKAGEYTLVEVLAGA